MRPQRAEDGLRYVAREDWAAQLVVHDGGLIQLVFRVGDAVGQALHGLDKIAALADDPGADAPLESLGPAHRGAIFGRVDVDDVGGADPQYRWCRKGLGLS